MSAKRGGGRVSSAGSEQPDTPSPHNRGLDAGSDWRARVVGRSLAPAADKAVRRGQQLIAAASKLILVSGADDFTVQQVASQAGLSLRAFYQHFEGKDDLLIALIEESNVVLAELLDHHAERFDEPLDQLGSALYFCVDPRQHTPSSYNAASTRFTIRTSMSAPAALARARRPVVEAYARLIDKAIAAGSLEATVPERASFWLIATQTTYSRALYVGNDLTEELPSSTEFVRFCVDGLGARPAVGWEQQFEMTDAEAARSKRQTEAVVVKAMHRVRV